VVSKPEAEQKPFTNRSTKTLPFSETIGGALLICLRIRRARIFSRKDESFYENSPSQT
jgi:hypothetical protein